MRPAKFPPFITLFIRFRLQFLTGPRGEGPRAYNTTANLVSEYLRDLNTPLELEDQP